MTDIFRKAEEVFTKELEKILNKGDVNPTDLEYSYKIVDILKDLSEIKCNEDSHYDEGASGRNYYGMRSRNWSAYGDNGGYSRNYGRSYSNGYSGGNPMRAKLQRMMDEAGSESERNMIRSWMNELVE